jgi:lysophospholipase L1-like esterase
MKNGLTVLFQGDSITDGNRGRNDDPNHILGHGYQYIISSRIAADYPERDFKFINKGISGNRTVDLFARWKEDALNLKPDLVSILVGANDIGTEFSRKAGVSAEKMELVLDLILQETRSIYPDIMFVLCEPFILPVGNVKERWNEWFEEIFKRIEVVKKLALKYKTVYVPFQQEFDRACKLRSPEYWIWDGVHPTYAGHGMMANAWLDAVKDKLKLDK